MKKVLVIGDCHFPFICGETLSGIYLAIEREKPQVVIQIGDLYDFYSATHFPSSRNIMTPKHELEEGMQGASTMWSNIRKIVPKSECYQLMGNHDVRPKKRIIEMIPALEGLFHIGDLFKFKGVNTLLDDRDDLVLDGVVYEHGYYGSPGRHMKENMRPTVIGHTHRPWFIMENSRGQLLWELNVGYTADPCSQALSYPRKKWTKWVNGYGLIDSDGPRFCPLPWGK